MSISKEVLDKFIEDIKRQFAETKNPDYVTSLLQRLTYTVCLPPDLAQEVIDGLTERLKFAPVEITQENVVMVKVFLQCGINLDDYRTDGSSSNNITILGH